MRYLAIDLGDKRTGLALGDTITGLVSPVGVVHVPISDDAGASLLSALARAIEEHLGPPRSGVSTGDLVVGLPLNMDGTEGPRGAQVRAFAARLSAHVRRPIHFQDERLTSASADWTMARSGLTHKEKKNRRDAIAAAAILQDFIDARRSSPSPDPESA